jgi:hypothetical protein
MSCGIHGGRRTRRRAFASSSQRHCNALPCSTMMVALTRFRIVGAIQIMFGLCIQHQNVCTKCITTYSLTAARSSALEAYKPHVDLGEQRL